MSSAKVFSQLRLVWCLVVDLGEFSWAVRGGAGVLQGVHAAPPAQIKPSSEELRFPTLVNWDEKLFSCRRQGFKNCFTVTRRAK
jgi:hypothetical protein